MITIIINNVKIEYNKYNVKILNSYKIKKTKEMKDILNKFQSSTGYKFNRSTRKLIREWKTHNRLYALGLFQRHTKDCDFEENERKARLIVYDILGRF